MLPNWELMKSIRWPQAVLHDRCSRVEMTFMSLWMSKHFQRSYFAPWKSYPPKNDWKTHSGGKGAVIFSFCSTEPCAWGDRHLLGFPGRHFCFETTIAMCKHKNLAEPHSPHSFVTVHIHSVAKWAQQWQRTKNVKKEKRIDKVVEKTKHVAAVSAEQTLVPKERMLQNMFMNARPYWKRDDYMLSVARAWCTDNALSYTCAFHLSSCIHVNTQVAIALTLTGPECLCPFTAISFNGPPDNLLFSSVLLVWPPPQSLPQLSRNTQDLSLLSGGGGCKKSKLPAFQSWTCSEFSVIFKFNKTPYSHCCYTAKLNYTDSVCLISWRRRCFCVVLWSFLTLKSDVLFLGFGLSLDYTSYLLIIICCWLSCLSDIWNKGVNGCK